MNPVFWILVFLAMVFIWFILSFLFPIIGSFVKRLWDDAMYNIRKDDEK